jgi:hypothetical protein
MGEQYIKTTISDDALEAVFNRVFFDVLLPEK